MSLEIMEASEALASTKLRALVIGQPGDGKTHFCATCPKVYYIQFSEGESDTFATRPELKQNIVKVAKLVPDMSELRKLFGDMDKDIHNGLMHQVIKEAKEMYDHGEIETLVIDTITYLVEYLWQYVNLYCKKHTYKGEVDTRGMYGDLNTKMTRLIGIDIASFPGNLICTAHEMLESDEAMEKKPDNTNPVVPNILGGFRNKIGGLFSVVMFLTKKSDNAGKYTYYARTDMGNQRKAKSRLPLPVIIQNISYKTIMEEINKVSQPISQPK